ncbi:hypothetical protein ACWGCW_07160 [Streptomyces sp. NPDC054933]
MSRTLTGQDRPELQKAIEEIVDSSFAGVQQRVIWVLDAGVAPRLAEHQLHGRAGREEPWVA